MFRHRVYPVQIGKLWRYYPQYRRGNGPWQYYKDSKLGGTLWFVTEPGAELYLTHNTNWRSSRHQY